MREIPFSGFKGLLRTVNERRIALWGAGATAAKTARKLDREASLIIDNNKNLWGEKEQGLTIHPPEYCKNEGPGKLFVVISTMSFDSVALQLEAMGFEAEKDFVVSPLLNDLRIISELESYQAHLLFSSGLPPEESEIYGGGIYEVTLDGEYEYRKVFSGNTKGLIKFEGNYIAMDDHLGITELDAKFKVLRNQEMPHGTRGHGVAYSDITKCFYIAASHMDCVLIYDRDFKHVGSISISHKYERNEDPAHHCNDLCIVDESIYISMFSWSGNWKRDVYDGVVLEIDLPSKEIKRPVIQSLWMPHNVVYLEGSLAVLDSLRGEFKMSNAQPRGRFPGFTRGLAYDGTLFFIGQSRNRNYSKYLGLSLNVSIDSSIILFDDETKASRSIQFPQRLSEIHAILSL